MEKYTVRGKNVAFIYHSPKNKQKKRTLYLWLEMQLISTMHVIGMILLISKPFRCVLHSVAASLYNEIPDYFKVALISSVWCSPSDVSLADYDCALVLLSPRIYHQHLSLYEFDCFFFLNGDGKIERPYVIFPDYNSYPLPIGAEA